MKNKRVKMDRPTLTFKNEADGEIISISFGYFGDDQAPTAGLFHGDKLILIPVSILASSISCGWRDDYTILCELRRFQPEKDGRWAYDGVDPMPPGESEKLKASKFSKGKTHF